jgi:hypothetical protein
VVRGVVVAASLMALACGDSEEPVAGDAAVIKVENCQGKCDGFDRVTDLFEDMKDVELDDLVVLGAPHATDALNDALSVSDYARIELGETTLYGAEEELFGETLVRDLGALSAGLTSRLGERDFAARVVRMRRDVAKEQGGIYAESRFTIGANLGHDLGFGGGDAVGRLGFRAGADVEAIAVSRFGDGDRVEAVLEQPLSAAKAARGFVLPRSMDDYARMSPGESLALRAEGGLGLNVGAGVPFLLASAGTALTVHARLSLAARAALEGKLDVQIVRGEGDELFVDVGMSGARIRSLQAALEPGFGVDAIPNVEVDLGVTRVGLGELANDAIRDQLQKHIDVRASIGASDEDGRLRVARFAIDLSRAQGAEVEAALAQLVRGDMRLAQALSRQGAGGVRQLIDMTKEYHHHDFRAGFDFLSMRFYIENGFDTGQVTVDTEEGTQTLLFTELQEKRGFFFTDRESSWRTLVSIEQRDGADVRGQVNVRHIMREGQETFSRDELLDHTDSVLATLVTPDAVQVLTEAIDAVGNAADDACRDPGTDASFRERRDYRECLLATPSNPDVMGLANQARAEVDRVIEFGAVRPGFGADGRQGTALLRELVEFEITVASAGYDAGENVAPDGQVVSELRVAHDGVQELMSPAGVDRFMGALEDTLRVMRTRRTNEDLDDKRADVEEKIEDSQSRLGKVREEFTRVSDAFADLDRAAALTFDGRQVGDHANLILVGEDRSLDLRTVAEHKGALLERFVPDIVDVADGSIFSGLGEPEIYVVGYALAGAVSPEHIEWVYSWTFDDDERLTFAPFNFYTRGGSEFIDAGVFDLDVLLGAKP